MDCIFDPAIFDPAIFATCEPAGGGPNVGVTLQMEPQRIDDDDDFYLFFEPD